MKKIAFFMFLIWSLTGCNGVANEESATSENLITGNNVNYQPGQSNNSRLQQVGTVRNVGNGSSRGLGDTLEPNPMSDFFIADVIDLTNEERRRHGLPSLTTDIDLQKAAQLKAEDMSANHELSYQSTQYGTPFQMLRSLGITFQTAAENIAYGPQTPREVVDAWMNHTEYRDNILHPDMTHLGVGYVTDGNYWAQLFIKR
ncbi:CAP domain-containing protein [Bacillus pinisoli]|uniref:CAP domain-containing protein n=1 Tax=Bacillus pinisoli TaxID=2901866 RepID=UPI001FF688C1|nr:CAP domain-containing protein [Bacillus pinisoli]